LLGGKIETAWTGQRVALENGNKGQGWPSQVDFYFSTRMTVAAVAWKIGWSDFCFPMGMAVVDFYFGVFLLMPGSCGILAKFLGFFQQTEAAGPAKFFCRACFVIANCFRDTALCRA